jgi:hypothetical protein
VVACPVPGDVDIYRVSRVDNAKARVTLQTGPNALRRGESARELAALLDADQRFIAPAIVDANASDGSLWIVVTFEQERGAEGANPEAAKQVALAWVGAVLGGPEPQIDLEALESLRASSVSWDP